jgi:hypothetical protein
VHLLSTADARYIWLLQLLLLPLLLLLLHLWHHCMADTSRIAGAAVSALLQLLDLVLHKVGHQHMN